MTTILLRWFINFSAYITTAAAIMIVGLELIGLFVFDNRYSWDSRYLFYSKKPIVNEYSTSKPFWKYQPNSNIRFVAVYSNWNGFRVEYDCILRTNSYGFTDTGATLNQTDLLILGDSYLEGHGGCPWLTKSAIDLDPVLRKLGIFNGGLQGAGVLQFEQTLEYVTSISDVKNVLIIAISNDFKRGDSFTWDVDGECYSGGACGINDYWFYVPYDATQEDIIEMARQRQVASASNFHDFLTEESFTYRVFLEYKKIIRNYSGISNDFNSVDSYDLFVENFAALERIRELYPDVKLILIPQRDEVGLLGVKNLDSQVVEEYLDDRSFDYKWCELSSTDYMPVDGHPNSIGYAKLFDCLQGEI